MDHDYAIPTLAKKDNTLYLWMGLGAAILVIIILFYMLIRQSKRDVEPYRPRDPRQQNEQDYYNYMAAQREFARRNQIQASEDMHNNIHGSEGKVPETGDQETIQREGSEQSNPPGLEQTKRDSESDKAEE